MIKCIMTYGFLMTLLLAFGQETNFKAGNESYEAGEYALAAEKYSSVVSEGYHSAELYYNLGNAHYRNGEIGKAIWAYESALKIKPDHEDALFNLAFVNAQTVDKLDTSRQGFGHWIQGLAFGSNINTWFWISIICSVLFSLLATVFVKSKKRSTRNFSLISATIFVFGLIISIWAGHQHKEYVTSRTQGVVIATQVEVLVSPQEEANISYKLGEGAKVNLVSDEKDWVQIDLNGNQGWLQKKDIWEI